MMNVRAYTESDRQRWEAFVDSSTRANLYHRVDWRAAIARAAGHEPLYLLAEDDRQRVRGVLPLFRIRSRLFGHMLLSMPFLNYGGIAAEGTEAEDALIAAARRLREREGADYVELRHLTPPEAELPTNDLKVTFRIPLFKDPDAVWKNLHQNVRNKVRKAKKAGLRAETGPHLADEFYDVYSHNLRDLGTPVLPKRFFLEVAAAFGDRARFYAARRNGTLQAAKLILIDKETVYFIWAAAFRETMREAPVPFLNWAALQDMCDDGITVCDLGRSTRDSPQAKFKKYWGGNESPLSWQYLLPDGGAVPGLNPTNPKFELAIRTWKKLPVWLTRIVGPPLAKVLP